ncbi:MAG: thioredoxin family protein [Calditrichota bacterium]|jgi:hypothetical protein
MKIEFFYFEDCPSCGEALQNLKEVLAEKSFDNDLKVIRIDSPVEAKKYNFQGSPSVKIDGKDWEEKNDIPGMQCRLYTIDGKLTGVPPKEFIREKLFHHH